MNDVMNKLTRKDRSLISTLEGLKHNDDTMGVHDLSTNQVETRIVSITPEIAEKLLERNVSNRHVNKINVKVFASEMTKGKWQFNGEAIVFDNNGDLRNGQHRLYAIIDSQTTQLMLVITGVLPDSFATMDIGGRRNGSDILSIKNIMDPKAVSALCKFVYTFKNAKFSGTQHANRTLSNTEIFDYYETLGDVTSSIEFGTTIHKDKSAVIKPLNKQQLCGFHYIFSEKNPEQASEFLKGIFYGTSLDADSPILAMRNKLLKAKQNKNYRISNKEFVISMVVTWNKWRNNEKSKKIQLPKKLDEFKLEII